MSAMDISGPWLSCAPTDCCLLENGHESLLPLVPGEGEDAQGLLPDLQVPVQTVLWPVEQLLVRSFQLPLQNPRLLDASILAQLLEEVSGAQPSGWWLAWHASAVDAGVAGMVFGLPESVRQAMQKAPVWRDLPSLRVDAWERLSRHVPADAGAQVLALVDQDADGLFLGVFAAGGWQGMRRLNWSAVSDVRDKASVASELLMSLQSMAGEDGWQSMRGCLSASLYAQLSIEASMWAGTVQADDALPGRHAANLQAMSETSAGVLPALNFRHGTWAPRKPWQHGMVWKRPLQVAMACVLIWLLGSLLQMVRLNAQLSDYQASVMQSFHEGLPNETVVVDPVAQLQRAVGQGVGSTDARAMLRELAALAEVYRRQPWEIGELSLSSGQMQMFGTAANIQQLNAIRSGLQQHLGRQVTILDTDLAGAKVAFRMQW